MMSDSSSPVGVPSSYLRQFSNSMLSWHWTHCSLWKSHKWCCKDFSCVFTVLIAFSNQGSPQVFHPGISALFPTFSHVPHSQEMTIYAPFEECAQPFQKLPQCQLFIFLISFKSIFGSDWFFEPLILPKLHLTSENMTSSFNKDAHRLFLSMLIFKDFLRVLSANFFLWWRPFILLYFYSSEHFFLIILFHL